MQTKAPNFWMGYKNHRLSAQGVHVLVSYPLKQIQNLGVGEHWRFIVNMKAKASDMANYWNLDMSGFKSKNPNKMLPIFQSYLWNVLDCRSEGRKMPRFWNSVVLQHHIHLNSSISSHKQHHCSLQDQVMIIYYNPLVSWPCLFMDSAYSQPVLDNSSSWKTQTTPCCGWQQVYKSRSSSLCWLTNYPSKTLTQVKCLQKLWLKRAPHCLRPSLES